MSSYEKTLKSLKEIKTFSSHLTALGKIKAVSEDTSLKQAIDALVRELQYAHATSKKKSTPTSLENATVPEAKALLQYCQRAIGSKKPEWQIIAERHNWVPPKA